MKACNRNSKLRPAHHALNALISMLSVPFSNNDGDTIPQDEYDLAMGDIVNYDGDDHSSPEVSKVFMVCGVPTYSQDSKDFIYRSAHVQYYPGIEHKSDDSFMDIVIVIKFRISGEESRTYDENNEYKQLVIRTGIAQGCYLLLAQAAKYIDTYFTSGTIPQELEIRI